MISIDTGLLVIFVELLSKRNAAYMAERVHMITPAVSHSLDRLHEIFDDPPFIRMPYGSTPTSKAPELDPRVCETLNLRAAINEDDIAMLDLIKTIGTFNVSFTGTPGDMLFDRFLPHIKYLVPTLQVCLTKSSSREVDVAVVRANRLDLAFSLFPMCRPEIMKKIMTFFSLWVCAYRNYPILGDRCTLGQYLECRHIFIAQGGPGLRVALSLVPPDYALQQRGPKHGSTMTVYS